MRIRSGVSAVLTLAISVSMFGFAVAPAGGAGITYFSHYADWGTIRGAAAEYITYPNDVATDKFGNIYVPAAAMTTSSRCTIPNSISLIRLPHPDQVTGRSTTPGVSRAIAGATYTLPIATTVVSRSSCPSCTVSRAR